MKTVIITILLGLVTALSWAVLSRIYNNLKTPVVISPRQIPLRADEWNIKTVFNLTNRTQEMLYDIYLKLVIEGSRAKSKNIEIGPKTGPTFIPVNLSDISVNFDVVRLDGVDSQGKECVFLILYALAPEATESFVIDCKSDRGKTIEPGRIVLKVTSYSKKQPVPLLSKGGIAFSFKPPENFTVKRCLLLMKKEHI
jgi:hypothetical protein